MGSLGGKSPFGKISTISRYHSSTPDSTPCTYAVYITSAPPVPHLSPLSVSPGSSDCALPCLALPCGPCLAFLALLALNRHHACGVVASLPSLCE